MAEGTVVLPYSRKALKALADTLKIHSELLWMDPTTNALSLKQFTAQDQMNTIKEESR